MYPPPLGAVSILLLLKGVLTNMHKVLPFLQGISVVKWSVTGPGQVDVATGCATGVLSFPPLFFMVYWVSWGQLVSLPGSVWSSSNRSGSERS